MSETADATPLNDSLVQVTLLEEEGLGLSVEERLCHESSEEIDIGRVVLDLLHGWRIFREEDVGFVGKPTAGLHKGFVEEVHGEGDGVAMGVADETSEGVGSLRER